MAHHEDYSGDLLEKVGSPGTSPAFQGWYTPTWVGEEGTALALAAGRLAKLRPTPRSIGVTF